MNFLIERDTDISGPDYTRGRLREVFAAGTEYETLSTALCFTVERGLNDPTYPCIPEGTYKAVLYYSPKNRATVWLLEAIPGRSFIEIHPANYPHELLGCIAPGKMLMQSVGGEYGVGRSKEAFKELMKLTKDETEIEIEVRWKKEAL